MKYSTKIKRFVNFGHLNRDQKLVNGKVYSTWQGLANVQQNQEFDFKPSNYYCGFFFNPVQFTSNLCIHHLSHMVWFSAASSQSTTDLFCNAEIAEQCLYDVRVRFTQFDGFYLRFLFKTFFYYSSQSHKVTYNLHTYTYIYCHLRKVENFYLSLLCCF